MSGPVTMGERTQLCMPIRDGESIVFGDLLRVSDAIDQAVILDDVALEGVPEAEAYVLPIMDQTMQGGFSLDEPPATWGERESAEDYRVEPGTLINVVAVLPPRTEALPATAMTVAYHFESGLDFEIESGSRFVLEPDACF